MKYYSADMEGVYEVSEEDIGVYVSPYYVKCAKDCYSLEEVEQEWEAFPCLVGVGFIPDSYWTSETIQPTTEEETDWEF